MRALSSALRKQLESAVVAARRASESACRAALDGLGVFSDRRPEHLDSEQTALRNGLRAKWRQLGGERGLLVSECAYEQWHRLLFARFLAENHLLLHPQYRAPVTLPECEELAGELGEPDGWSVAARFAAEILPGIFRLDDPCLRLRLTPEGRDALERLVAGLPEEVFVADDALGWVYQFWQKDKKDEVNASERKIGGADLAPVTQLFTENYMVRFLLENALGAWWARRHPSSPLVKDFDFLRYDGADNPAAGGFEGWPARVAEVTVMDPCCGSGHFLVEAFGMLWRMRVEEEGLDPVSAQDAVLAENLFGLELDPRCVQIAMFAVALAAWKAGGGWRDLPVPNVACSGIPIKGPVDEWQSLAHGDERLELALKRLHTLFKDADTLGSLIDPRGVAESGSAGEQQQRSLEEAHWEQVAPLLARAVAAEAHDPTTAVLGADAVSIARAADLLSRRYTLIATNVPYLGRGKMVEVLREFSEDALPTAKHDLATVFLSRIWDFLSAGGTAATVTPQNWTYLPRYEPFRRVTLETRTLDFVGRLGTQAFDLVTGWVVNIMLSVASRRSPVDNVLTSVDASVGTTAREKAELLLNQALAQTSQLGQLNNPDARITFVDPEATTWLMQYAHSRYGLRTGDANRFIRFFWELPEKTEDWVPHLSTTGETKAYGGRSNWLLWENGQGALAEYAQLGIASLQGADAWGKRGVVISLIGHLPSYLYTGERYDNNCAVLWPIREEDLDAIWAYVSSPEFSTRVREIDQSLKVMNATLLKVPFDADHWRRVAEESPPLPEPGSDDPTQWLFDGRPEASTAALQVAVARLLGYQWPEQPQDDLDALTDVDGIVCLPSVAGEAPAVDRVQQVLDTAFGEAWSPAKARQLLEQAQSKKKNLADWLRDGFFKQHCALFGNRPFIWHIWDGQRDGFSALVNYHRLDRRGLEKLTYTYLGQDWVERQRAEVRDEVPGAETRLSAALDLQRKLEAILTGERPFDIYVRWSELREQPVGWEPDLNNGVRMNIRPFVKAGVLRSPFNIHWKKDRGKNPDGSERHNDLHLALAEKVEAREEGAVRS